MSKINQEIFLRPRFVLSSGKSQEKILKSFEETRNNNAQKFIVKIIDEHVFIDVSEKDSHFWSPQLHLEIIQKEDKTEIARNSESYSFAIEFEERKHDYNYIVVKKWYNALEKRAASILQLCFEYYMQILIDALKVIIKTHNVRSENIFIYQYNVSKSLCDSQYLLLN